MKRKASSSDTLDARTLPERRRVRRANPRSSINKDGSSEVNSEVLKDGAMPGMPETVKDDKVIEPGNPQSGVRIDGPINLNPSELTPQLYSRDDVMQHQSEREKENPAGLSSASSTDGDNRKQNVETDSEPRSESEELTPEGGQLRDVNEEEETDELDQESQEAIIPSNPVDSEHKDGSVLKDVDNIPDWRIPIRKYIETGDVPKNKWEARKLKGHVLSVYEMT
ncbi:unnamed protein product [Arabis nemorensis]|uniref:Uncharacterized protein n=1 Tax=Arabis nemorensis TaxID=586526 RepID=A0A565B1I1_9BRAS|nr:unnamed protein product [Arabis nemorensis]